MKKFNVVIKLSNEYLDFILQVDSHQALMFTQENDDEKTYEYFKNGKSIDQIRRYNQWGSNRRLDKTIEKIKNVYFEYTFYNEIYPFDQRIKLDEKNKKPYYRRQKWKYSN